MSSLGATYVFSYVTVSEMEEYPDSRETLLAWGRMFQYTNTVLPWMRAASWFPYFVGSVVEPDRRWQFVAMALLAQSGDPVTWFFYDKAVNELRTLRMHSLVLRDWALPDYVLTQDLIMRWSTWSTLCSVGPLVVAWLGLGYIEEYAPGSEQQQQANGPGAAAAQGGDAPSPPQSFYSFAPDPPVPTPPASRRSNSRGSQASNNAASGALNGAAPGALNGAAPGGGAAPGAAPGAAAFGGGAAPGAAAPGAAFGGAASPRAASSRAASEQAPSQQQDQDLGWLDELYPQAP